MTLRWTLVLSLMISAGALSGCIGGSSSGSGADDTETPDNGNTNGDSSDDAGDENGGGDNGSGGSGGSSGSGGDVDAQAPPGESDSFAQALALDYPGPYTGDAGWASIEAAYEGDPDEQDQRLAMDTAALGTVLATAIHFMDREVQAETGGELDLHAAVGLEECQDSQGGVTLEGDTLEFSDACVVPVNLDGREFVLNGDVYLDQDPGVVWPDEDEQPTRLLEFSGLQVGWNGQQFSLVGAVANQSFDDVVLPGETLSGEVLHAAWDVEHMGSSQVFRFARRMTSLGSDVYYQDLAYSMTLDGAVAQNGSMVWYETGNCSDEGLRSEGTQIVAADLEDPLFASATPCDTYFYDPVSTSPNIDSNDKPIQPRAYQLFASVGMENPGYRERTLPVQTERHFNLIKTPDAQVAVEDPRDSGTGRAGSDGADDTSISHYQVTMSFDSDVIDSLSPSDVLSGVLGFAQAGRGESAAQSGSPLVVPVAWGADNPQPGDYQDNQVLFGDEGEDFIRYVGDGAAPWRRAVVTNFIQPENSAIQFVALRTGEIDPRDGERFTEYCLRQGSLCSEEQLPVLTIITKE